MNNKSLRAFNRWWDKKYGKRMLHSQYLAKAAWEASRLESDPEPGGAASGMDPAMRRELEAAVANDPAWGDYYDDADSAVAKFARHLLDTYGTEREAETEREKVCEWRPICTAPHDEYILIRDGHMLPDFVRWKDARPARVINGTQFLPVPEGWFTRTVGRSSVTTPTHWFPIPSFCGGRIKEVE